MRKGMRSTRSNSFWDNNGHTFSITVSDIYLSVTSKNFQKILTAINNFRVHWRHNPLSRNWGINWLEIVGKDSRRSICLSSRLIKHSLRRKSQDKRKVKGPRMLFNQLEQVNSGKGQIRNKNRSHRRQRPLKDVNLSLTWIWSSTSIMWMKLPWKSKSNWTISSVAMSNKLNYQKVIRKKPN